ncbi:DUF1707 domain-containing protein [Lipingzhangella sp. LS1_29]|uniref:DUF1707 domain-containing protein n=1 Tax=Lipingzhangella rawalii TaxID=2055835 RepID=A0ABU2H4W4_9ACTN|nr:DUF1707 domain-containing protein [Lipingzhangella rawalii]MDS1270032.1 DUF1707 domain-containing protein [Lipingzhangella rawalii]
MATHDQGNVRASDADRDQVAERLRDALAEGRLTPEEHGERVDRLYSARTLAELADLTTDLPQTTGSTAATGPTGTPGPKLDTPHARELAAQSTGQDRIVAILSGTDRTGRWLVEPQTQLTVLLGGADLDLREAVLAERQVVIQCAVILGGADLTVPPGIRVVNQVNSVLGGVEVASELQTPTTDAPTVRLTGTCLLGGIDVHTTPSAERAGC